MFSRDLIEILPGRVAFLRNECIVIPNALDPLTCRRTGSFLPQSLKHIGNGANRSDRRARKIDLV